MNNQTEKKKLSTGAIVTLAIMYPIGLGYLMYKLPRSEPRNYTKYSKYLLFGIPLMILAGIFYVMMGLTGNIQTGDDFSVVQGMITMSVACVAFSIALLAFGCKYLKLGKLYEKYAPLVLYNRTESIDTLAATMGINYGIAVAELDKLITAGAFQNVCIDHRERKLILPEVQTPPKIAVTCPHCNGTNEIIPGEDVLCDYCGAPLN